MVELSSPPAPDSADLAACHAQLRHHARSFHVASLLLPRSVRDPASVLYAFCRVADDAVDLAPAHRDRLAAVATLRDRLHRAYAGTPRATPIDRAFAAVVARHAIPRLLPERLLEGLEWDARGHRYETLADVHEYASRVAGTVGAMMAVLMGVRSARGLARACDLGVAMQLSNIARDVAEDAAMGRLYLPAEWMRAEGIDPDAWLARPRHDAALDRVVRRLLDEAARLYGRAAAGIAELPLSCRPGINAARLLYAAIGDRVARDTAVAFARRASVPGTTKAWLVARATVTPWPRSRDGRASPLPANRALVEAATLASCAPARARAIAAPGDAHGVAFVVDLFTRLERRDRLATNREAGSLR